MLHLQARFRVHGDLVVPLVKGTNAILPHEPLALFEGRRTSSMQFSYHAQAAISRFRLGMDGTYHHQHLRVHQVLTTRCAATLPCSITADALVQRGAHVGQREHLGVLVNPALLHRTSRAKHAAAFVVTSFSRFKRATSARCWDNAIASGATTLLPVPSRESAALTQSRNVCVAQSPLLGCRRYRLAIGHHALDGKLLEPDGVCLLVPSSFLVLPKSRHFTSPLDGEISGEARCLLQFAERYFSG
jgi:hypothetical protein